MTDREQFKTMAARLGSALELVQRETTVGTSDNVMTLLCMADEAIKLLRQAARASSEAKSAPAQPAFDKTSFSMTGTDLLEAKRYLERP